MMCSKMFAVAVSLFGLGIAEIGFHATAAVFKSARASLWVFGQTDGSLMVYRFSNLTLDLCHVVPSCVDFYGLWR